MSQPLTFIFGPFRFENTGMKFQPDELQQENAVHTLEHHF